MKIPFFRKTQETRDNAQSPNGATHIIKIELQDIPSEQVDNYIKIINDAALEAFNMDEGLSYRGMKNFYGARLIEKIVNPLRLTHTAYDLTIAVPVEFNSGKEGRIMDQITGGIHQVAYGKDQEISDRLLGAKIDIVEAMHTKNLTIPNVGTSELLYRKSDGVTWDGRR